MDEEAGNSVTAYNGFSDDDEPPFVTITIGCCEKATEEKDEG
jgi:hypothetical protein